MALVISRSRRPAPALGPAAAQRADVRLIVPPHLAQRVAAELLQHRVRQRERDHGLRRSRPRAGTAVTSDRSLCALAGAPEDRSTVGSGRHERRDRLHRRPGPPPAPRRDPALEAPGVVGCPAEPTPRSPGPPALPLPPPHDGIVHLGPRPPAASNTQARSRPLHGGMDMRSPASRPVQLPVPAHVAAEPDHNAAGDDFDLSSQGVAGPRGLVDRGGRSRARPTGRAPAPRSGRPPR